MQLDVVRAGPGLEDELLARARPRRVGSARVPFIESNDLVVLKVLAGRPKDLEDVRGLLRVAPEVSAAVVRRRLLALSELLADSTLVSSFDALVAECGPHRRSGRGLRRT